MTNYDSPVFFFFFKKKEKEKKSHNNMSHMSEVVFSKFLIVSILSFSSYSLMDKLNYCL